MINSLRGWLDPFEILYLAIAIATFEHTQWAAAYMFEGAMPADPTAWFLRGALIAIAVDVGMLASSRLLATSVTASQRLVLVVAFALAAIVSFYAQVVYISLHTPTVALSAGVSGYWAQALGPLLEARVIILPLALPALATVYTLARLTRHHVTPRSSETTSMVDDIRIVAVDEPGATSETPHVLLRIADDIYHGYLSEDQVTTIDGYSVDLMTNSFYDHARQKAYGPYRSRASMLGAMKQAARRPQLPPGGVK